MLGWRCCSCIQGPAPISGRDLGCASSPGSWWWLGHLRWGLSPGWQHQGCSGNISISPSGSVQDAALGTHPTAPSILSSLTFLTPHPPWSKQSFQTFWFGKGINHEPLSLFHLNIKLKSKQYKVHFLMCCPILVGLLSLFFFRGTVIKSRDKARTVLCRSLYLCYLSPFFTLRAALLFFALISLHQNAKNRKKKLEKKKERGSTGTFTRRELCVHGAGQEKGLDLEGWEGFGSSTVPEISLVPAALRWAWLCPLRVLPARGVLQDGPGSWDWAS